jgi:hypothetical protein
VERFTDSPNKKSALKKKSQIGNDGRSAPGSSRPLSRSSPDSSSPRFPHPRSPRSPGPSLRWQGPRTIVARTHRSIMPGIRRPLFRAPGRFGHARGSQFRILGSEEVGRTVTIPVIGRADQGFVGRIFQKKLCDQGRLRRRPSTIHSESITLRYFHALYYVAYTLHKFMRRLNRGLAFSSSPVKCHVFKCGSLDAR